jgi:hypothetical protein
MSASAVTEAGRAANRANASESAGPRTPDGKARAARNSTSHGIFCRDLLLDGEDARLFRNIRESEIHRLRPQDALELMFVDRIVQAQWRLNRCQRAERHAHREQAARARRRAGAELGELRRYHDFRTREELELRGRPRDGIALERLGELEELNRPVQDPGLTLMLGMRGGGRGGGRALDRLGNYEQRLERTMHRALSELRLLRGKEAKAWEDLPASPYAGTAVESDDELGRDAQATEGDAPAEAREDVDDVSPSPRVLVRGEGGGEGQGAYEDEVRPSAEPVSGGSSGASSSAKSAIERDITPRVARPSPQPSPRRTRKREQEAPAAHAPAAQASRKNEPVSALTHLTASTGENSLVEPVGDIAVATSAVPAGRSATGSENDATPDPLVVTESAPTSIRPPPANSSM